MLPTLEQDELAACRLSTIDKSLVLLKDEGLTHSATNLVFKDYQIYLTRAMAVRIYTSLPDMFNHFDRGYDLFLSLPAKMNFNNSTSLQPHGFIATQLRHRFVLKTSSKHRCGLKKWKE